MKAFRFSLVLLLALAVISAGVIGCAPPPEKYSAPAPVAEKTDTTFRTVELTDALIASETSVLTVLLPELLPSPESLIELAEFYVGPVRYALIRSATEPHGSVWSLYCFNANTLDSLVQNAGLLSFSSADEFTFISGSESSDGWLPFPELITCTRAEIGFEQVVSPLLSSCESPISFGACTDEGAPASISPLPELENLILTTGGIEMCFAAESLSREIPHPFVTVSFDGKVHITIYNCLLGNGVPAVSTNVAAADLTEAEALQNGVNTEIILTLASAETPLCSGSSRLTRTEFARHRSVCALDFSFEED